MEVHPAELQRLIAKVFQSADEEGKGHLTEEDYKVAVIQLLGYKPSKHEIENVWREVGSEGEGLTLKQFTDLLLPRLLQRDSSEVIRQMFLAFDRFCHGFISLDDCRAAFKKIVPHMSDKRVESFFQEIDTDLDGRVSYRDFELMTKYLIIP